MAKRNDSSQVRDLMRSDEDSDPPGASSSSSCVSSSPQPSCPADVSGGRVEAQQAEDGSSSACPMNRLKHLPQCENRAGRLTFSRTSSVLVDVEVFNRGGGVVPREGRDMWNANFVKMPSSPSSVMLAKSFLSTPSQTSRWDVISKKLNALAKRTTASAEDVEDAIMKYNPKYKGQWSFDALISFVQVVPKAENDFAKLFPKIAALALQLPAAMRMGVPLLKRGSSASITLSQVQISCLLANAFFCTFPHRNAAGPHAEYTGYPSINFTRLFGQWSSRKKEKLRAVMQYFRVMTKEQSRPNGLVTFERRCFKDTEMPNWTRCEEKMNKLHVASGGAIETEGTGLLQVDFASSWVGGGVLGSGLVQEEILFLLSPELIVSRLFTEKLGDTECLIVTGSQQFSRYSGFGDSFEWAGPHDDLLRRDEWARLQRRILAIDAMNFKHRSDQYTMSNVTRELNKAYCGFKGRDPDEPDVATGKWGCGVFNGDPQLKAVIQLMAAAKARRGLAFFTFQDEDLKRGLERLHHQLLSDGATVGRVFRLLKDYCAVQKASGAPHVDLFLFLSRSRL